MKDYYKILNISRNASQKEIKNAYRKGAMFWHPDKNNSTIAQEKFIEIQEAYEFLSDLEKKEVYDALYKQEEIRKKANHKNYEKKKQGNSSYKEPETRSYSTTQNPFSDKYYQKEYRKYEDWLKEVRYKARQKANKPLDNMLTESFHFLDNYGIFIIIAFFILSFILLLSL